MVMYLVLLLITANGEPSAFVFAGGVQGLSECLTTRTALQKVAPYVSECKEMVLDRTEWQVPQPKPVIPPGMRVP